MRLNTLIRRVERLQGELLPAVKEACVKKKDWIIAANKEQLRAGLNADGNLMNGGRYSLEHTKVRKKMGLPTDHVYLSFYGDLQAGMDVLFGDTGFEVRTSDWKQELINEVMEDGWWPTSSDNWVHYGPVFGLTAEKKGELARLIAPSVASKIRNRLLR